MEGALVGAAVVSVGAVVGATWVVMVMVADGVVAAGSVVWLGTGLLG